VLVLEDEAERHLEVVGLTSRDGTPIVTEMRA
jgi:hypothetical protein